MKLSDLHEPLGWTLLHFLWQGAAVAGVYSVLLLCVRRSARGRYLSGIVALAVMGIAFGVTFTRQMNAAAESRSAASRETAAVSRVLPPPVSIAMPAEEPSMNARGTASSETVPLALPLSSGPDREVALRTDSQRITSGEPPDALTIPASTVPAGAPAWARPLHSALPWIVSAWGLGVVLLLLRFVLGWRSVRRMRVTGHPPHDSLLQQRFTALCERLRISRPVQLIVSSSVGVPALVGWLKPVVIIPAALLAGLTPAQTGAILAHELGHVRRNDFLINALQCLLEIILFYHPAVWWVSAQVRREREHCCDDIAAACCGGAADYARALAALEEWRGTAVPALSMTASGGSLIGRIRRLLGHRESAAELPVWPLSLAAGALLFAGLPLAWLNGAFAQSSALPTAAGDAAPPDAIPKPPTDTAASPQPPRSSSASLIELDNDTRLKLAIAAADGFFRAGDAAAKMKFLRLDDASRAAAERHFQKHGARAENRAQLIMHRMGEDSGVLLWYDLSARNQFIRATEQDGTMLLDWENSTMCQQGVYNVAETERPEDPFRILAVSRADDYYNFGFSDQARWACHKLRFPGVEVELYAYVDRTSADFEMLQERHQQGLSTTLAFTVKIPADTQGKNQVEILKVEPVNGGENKPGKTAAVYPGQKEIRHAGTHVMSPRITVKVTSEPDEGTLRNTLEIESRDDAGNKFTDSAALPYGMQTWALLIEEPSPPNGSCIVSIGSRWGVRRVAFVKRGFHGQGGWVATENQIFSEQLPPHANAAVVDWWDNHVRHILKVEMPRDQPRLEVRLVSGGNSRGPGSGPEVEMIRPEGAYGLRRFVRLGARLLAAEDLEEVHGSFGSGIRWYPTSIREASRPKFKALCRQYSGRTAAMISNGQVIGTFKLDPARIMAFHTASRPDYPVSPPSAAVSASAAPAGAPAHVITVQNSADGKPLSAFRVIAGVRSSMSADFEKKHSCSVVNWQSHMLGEGKDGKLEWSVTERSYDEMVLRIEADGFVPQMTGWLKKADGAQEITVTLALDPGIRGSVQTPGNKRWAHDATVVLGMIRKEIRIKGATFPELDLGPEPKSLRDKWDRPLVMTPDDDGRFTLPTEVDPTAVVLILHGDGVYLKPYAVWKEDPHAVLEPWGRIHGHVQWGPRKGAGDKVDLGISLGDDWGWPDIITQRDTETANEDGIFVFQRVIPGVTAQLSSPFKVKGENGGEVSIYESARICHVKTISPHGSAMLGGVGRTVTGRCIGRLSWEGVTYHFHPTAPHIGLPGDEAQWKAWQALQQSADGPTYFRDGLKVAADGTFKIEGMLPGSYQIFFTGPEGKDHIGSTQIRVPAEDLDREEAPSPYDAGEVKVK